MSTNEFSHVVVAQHESGDISIFKCANEHVARIFCKEFSPSDPGYGSAVVLEKMAHVFPYLRSEEILKFHSMPVIKTHSKCEATAFAKAAHYSSQVRKQFSASSYSYGGLEKEWNQAHDRLCVMIFGEWQGASTKAA